MTIDEIKKLIKAGNVEEANAAMDKLEEENKQLFEEKKLEGVENKALENKKPEEVIELKKVEKVEDVKNNAKTSYENVFAKILMGRDLDLQDKLKFEEVNNVAYTHQVANQPIVAASGVTFGKNNARELPYFAFGFIGNVEGGGKKVVWYPKTQLSIVIDEEYATAEDETKIDDVTANLVATGLINNGVIHSSFDSNRDSATGVSYEKFISEPIYDEKQWAEIVAAQSGGTGGGE